MNPPPAAATLPATTDAAASVPCERRIERGERIVGAALVIAAVAPFMASLLYGFVYDDTGIILHNPVIQGWRSLVEVWRHPYWANSGPEKDGLYRPLLMAIFALVWNGAHRFAIAFHLVAVAAHAMATLLVWRLLRRAVSAAAAAGAALWFALHPVHVEAVANIANSSEVLVGCWTLLLALLLTTIGRADVANSERAPRGWRLAAATALYAAALLTKESGAVAPGLALIAALGWRRPTVDAGGAPRAAQTTRAALVRALRDWTPMLLAWIGVVLAVVVARAAVLGGVIGAHSIAAPGLQDLRPGERILAMLALGGRIAGLLFWPRTQNPHYGPSVLPADHGVTLAAAVTLGALIAVFVACAALAHRRRDTRPLAAVLWCCIAFLPASNLLTATGQILAERTLYLSSIGAAMLVAWTIARVPALVGVRRVGAGVATVIAVVVIAVCARSFVHTRAYVGVWRNHERLFRAMVDADSSSYRGYQLLALEAKRAGDSTTAAHLYARAYRLYPDDRILAADYGEYLIATRQTLDAIPVARGLMRHDDMLTDRRAVTLLLNAISLTWGIDSLTSAAQELDARHPSATSALFLGLAREARGDSLAALDVFRRGLARAPNDSALALHAAALRHLR